MTMISLSPFEAAVYSSNRFQRAGWIIPLFIRFGCIGRTALVDVTGINKDTAARYLEDLAYLGIIIRQGLHDGYVLTTGGKQLVAALLLEPAVEVIDADPEKVENRPSPPSGEGRKPAFLKNLEEDSINLNDESSSKDSSEGRNPAFWDRAQIAIANLFGAAIGTEIHPAIIDEDILAWTAKGWKERGNFNVENGAVGMIYNKLKKGIRAPLQWRMNYHLILPDTFFEDVGLMTFKCAICAIDFPDRQAFEAHQHTQAAETIDEEIPDEALEVPDRLAPDESIRQVIVGDLTAADAWGKAKEQMKAEMPPATFDTWVMDAQPVRYGRNGLTVGARNTYTRDWLELRLTTRAETLLSKIIGQPIDVVFVVMQLES